MQQAILGFVGIILSVLALQAQPAVAQSSGDTAHRISGTWAGMYTRYYAPYALQAAGAYLPVADFDNTRGPNEQPGVDGADVALLLNTVQFTRDANTPDVKAHANRLLRAWQYQFGSEGYLTCFDPSDADCQSQFRGTWRFGVGGGPPFQVWARTRYPHRAHDPCTEVSIAFRGTTGSVGDWFSNFDPVNFATDDYYLQLRRNINGIIRKITRIDCYRRAQQPPQIVSLGHSLGGGLAQFAALANKPGGPRIAKVFAFDPSPITAAGRIDQATLRANAKGLTIDRIYQTGEVLAPLRRVAQQFPPSSSTCDPYVRTVVFDALGPDGAIRVHSMSGLTGEMVAYSYEAQVAFKIPKGTTACPTRYLAPPSDQEGVPGPAIAYAPNGAVVRIANGYRSRGAYRYVQTNPYGTADGYARDWGGSTPAAPARLKPPGARTINASAGSDMTFAQPNWYDTASFYPNATDAGVARPTVVRVQKSAISSGAHKARASKRHVPEGSVGRVQARSHLLPRVDLHARSAHQRHQWAPHERKASGPRSRGQAVSG